MSKQQYAWMLALMAAWRQQSHDEGGDEGFPMMATISGLAGQFRYPETDAANDLAARVLILMWVWWWSSAKFCAKVTNFSAVSRIFSGAAFLSPISLSAAPLAAARGSGSVPRQCQNDHLPTHPVTTTKN